MSNQYLKTAKELRAHIGHMVYWDDVCSRHVFLRSGTVTGVAGRNVEIDGDWKHAGSLPGLRNFEEGGAWARNKPK